MLGCGSTRRRWLYEEEVADADSSPQGNDSRDDSDPPPPLTICVGNFQLPMSATSTTVSRPQHQQRGLQLRLSYIFQAGQHARCRCFSLQFVLCSDHAIAARVFSFCTLPDLRRTMFTNKCLVREYTDGQSAFCCWCAGCVVEACGSPWNRSSHLGINPLAHP